MKRLLPGIVTLCAALGLAPSLAGQVIGLPVYNSGIPTGWASSPTSASPMTPRRAAPPTAPPGGWAWARSAPRRRWPGSIRRGRATSSPASARTLNYKVFGGPLVPLTVTLQGGAGYAKQDDVSFYRFPVGLGLGAHDSQSRTGHQALARAPARRRPASPSPLGSDTETNFGISGGVELNLLSGLGLHASYDRVFADVEDPSIFAAGLHYTFRVPGL